MKKIKFKKDFKYKFTIVVLSLLTLISVLSYQFTNTNFYIVSTFIGCLSVIAVLLSAIGLIKSINKLKKPTSKKRIFSIIIISVTACLFLYIIVSNIIKAIKFIS